MHKTIHLVVQVPAFNESQDISMVLNQIPKAIPGIDQLTIQVIDDGSQDDTCDVALANGADLVIRHTSNQGLARAFMSGMNHAIDLGADIIVNTDADSQYPGSLIPALIAPIVSGQADIVIGDREPRKNSNFPWYKRLLQIIGSWFVSFLSGGKVPDAASGFRAYSRYAALRLHVFNEFSYTLETIIQSHRERLKIQYLPIPTNPAIRPSRLHKGTFNFLYKQGGTIIRTLVLYRPIRSAILIGSPFILVGLVLITRFLFVYITGGSGIARYIQSVSIGGTLLLFGFMIFIVGFLGDAVRTNMRMLQEVLIRMRNSGSGGPGQTFDSQTVIRRDTKNDESEIHRR